jgi:hypothetical protein
MQHEQLQLRLSKQNTAGQLCTIRRSADNKHAPSTRTRVLPAGRGVTKTCSLGNCCLSAASAWQGICARCWHDQSGCKNNALHGWIAASKMHQRCEQGPSTNSRELKREQFPPKPHKTRMQATADTRLQTGQRGIPVSLARMCCTTALPMLLCFNPLRLGDRASRYQQQDLIVVWLFLAKSLPPKLSTMMLGCQPGATTNAGLVGNKHQVGPQWQQHPDSDQLATEFCDDLQAPLALIQAGESGRQQAAAALPRQTLCKTNTKPQRPHVLAPPVVNPKKQVCAPPLLSPKKNVCLRFSAKVTYSEYLGHIQCHGHATVVQHCSSAGSYAATPPHIPPSISGWCADHFQQKCAIQN